jgi:hypothetical protein
MSIPDEYYSRNGYPGNSGDHNTSIMSIPDECYSRNGYPGYNGDDKTSIMTYLMNVIPETVTQVIVVIIKLQ